KKAVLHGNARVTAEGLILDGRADYAAAPLERALAAKTLEAWVRLDSVEQRGGGVLAIQALNGSAFDAIVFGEQEAGRWMAGSENFVRSRSAGGEAEKDAARRAVHVAITYSADGEICLYRDGRPYGKGYKAPGPVGFPAGEAQVAFGMRHAP